MKKKLSKEVEGVIILTSGKVEGGMGEMEAEEAETVFGVLENVCKWHQPKKQMEAMDQERLEKERVL